MFYRAVGELEPCILENEGFVRVRAVFHQVSNRIIMDPKNSNNR